MKLPVCAVCLKEVDRLEERVDLHLDRLEIRVFCHGDIQRVTLAPDEASGIVFGMAFVDEGPARLGP